MKICLRLHMSKIFDSVWASKLLELFRSYGDVTAVVSGTASTVAMMDSGLDVTPLREARLGSSLSRAATITLVST